MVGVPGGLALPDVPVGVGVPDPAPWPEAIACSTTGCSRTDDTVPANVLSRDRLDLDAHPGSRPDAADIGFGDLREQLHLPQVRDREQKRRLNRGGNRLPDLDLSADHDAIDRGADNRVVQADAGLCNRGARSINAGDGGLHSGRRIPCGQPCEIELRRGHQVVGCQFLDAIELRSCVVSYSPQPDKLGARLGEPGAGLDQPCLVQGRVQARHDLSCLHRVVEIHFDRLDGA